MRRNSFGFVLVLGLLAGLWAPAEAGFIPLLPGVNTFEDQSREAFVDADSSGAFSVGDIIVGFTRFDNRTAPTGLVIGNKIYAIFSQEVTGITPVGPFSIVTFGPAPGSLALSAIVSALGGPAIPAGSMVAVVSKTTPFTKDLIIQSPGNLVGPVAVTMQDYLDLLVTEGQLDLAFGLLASPDTNFFAAVTAFPPPSTATIAAALTSDSLASFGAGLTLLLNNLGVPLLDAVSTSFAGFSTTAHLGISGGSIFGTNTATGTLANASEWTSIGGLSVLPQCGTAPCGFGDKANVTLVPEPTTLLLLGSGLAGLWAIGWRRSRRS